MTDTEARRVLASIREGQDRSPWYHEFIAIAEAAAASADLSPARAGFGDMVTVQIPENMINVLAIAVRIAGREDPEAEKFGLAAIGYLARGLKKN